MNWRRILVILCSLGAAVGWLGLVSALAPAAPLGAQQPAAQAAVTAPGIIKAEARLVLVDVIVTDKKGNYIRDLEAKDFHVFEDDQEQTITSFSPAWGSPAPNGPAPQRYIVLFFDNSTTSPAEQMRVREAAGRFIETAALNDRQFAVVDFGGEVRVVQNFTASVEALKKAVASVKFSAVQSNQPSLPPGPLIAARGDLRALQGMADFGARSLLLAIRGVSKMLREVPGRKTLILFSGGFALNAQSYTELAAAIDAANKSNVAVYPIDTRGLEGGRVTPGAESPDMMGPRSFPPGAALHESPFPHWDGLRAALLPPEPPAQGPQGPGGSGGPPQGPGGGGPSEPGGGGLGGGGVGPPPGGSTDRGGPTPGSTPGSPGGGLPSDRGGYGTGADRGGYGRDTFGDNNRPGYGNYPGIPIVPDIGGPSTNQQVLHALARGTGGLTILNTNDFVAGLTKVSKDLDQYYILGYVPPSRILEGRYHRIAMKVDRKGVIVRARNGYYDVKSPDLLAGKPEGKVLEEQAASPRAGDIPVSLTAAYFYVAANMARAHLALEVPASTLNFAKQKGLFHSEVNVLGIAYGEDNSVGARFSDTVKLDLEKKDLKDFQQGSFTYHKAFNVTPGKYRLKVVLGSGGEKFGKYETPLLIEPFEGKKLDLSGVTLSARIRPASLLSARLDELLMEERTALVFKGLEVVPSSSNRFKRSENVGFYVEVYEPLPIANGTPQVGVLYSIIDKETNQQVLASNTLLVNSFVTEGNPIIPVALKVPVAQLAAGEYRLEVRAGDSAGNMSPLRTADFVVD